MRASIEIQDATGARRTLTITGTVEVGRDVDPPGVRIDDPAASRRHLRLEVVAAGVVVTDLGSANGTRVGERSAAAPVVAGIGTTIELGGSTIVVRALDPEDAAPAPSPEHAAPAVATPPPGEPPATPARPLSSAMAETANDAVVVRYRPGTAGAEAAADVAERARRARARLAGIGSEPWGVRPSIYLVDPFPAPGRDDELVTEGSVVDADRDEIWVVATDEAPPEDPSRPLALLFGAHLPAAAELSAVLEGYGMVAGGAADPAEHLAGAELPPLEEATGELRVAMATSFVHDLLEREGDEGLRRLLGTSRPGTVDDVARDVYGQSMVELEVAWRRSLVEGDQRVPTGQFLRMARHYLRPHLRRQAEIFVYMLLGLAFTMIFPFVSRRLFDSALPSGELSQVVSLLALLGGAFAVSLLAGLRRAYVTAYVSSSVVMDVRHRMFDRLQQLDSGWFHRHQQGDVLSRMFSDVGMVQRGLSETLSEGAFQLVSLVVAAGVMLSLDLRLGAIVLLGAPLVALVYRVMGEGARTRSLAVQEQSSRLLSLSAENFAAGQVVKVFGLAGRERGRFDQAAQRLFRSQLRLNLYGGIFGLSVNSIVTFLRLFVLGFGAWLILEGRFTLGGLVAFLGIMGEVISPVTVLTGIGQELHAATGALQRVNEVLEAEPAIQDADDAVELGPLAREIRFDGVSFSYDGTHPTLDGLDLTIPAGAKVAFVGPSGSGKSTVLQLLMRMYDPDEGAVRFDGTDVRQATIRSHHAQLGIVFQDNFLFDTTVAENIALGHLGATDQQVRAAAAAAEVDDFIERLPRGYDTLVGERGALLSGGQRQRVAIARALIRQPSVLLLDEATSALDARTERQINDTIDRAGEGRTVVSVTHRLTSVTDYDVIFVLVDGALVEQGTHDELVADGGAYAHLWAEQTGARVATPAPEVVARAGLARLPLFADLDEAGLDGALQHLQVQPIPAGTALTETAERLVVLLSGRAEVRAEGIGGTEAVLAELGPGDAYGLAAVLGNPRGTELHVVDDAQLGVLDDAALRALAAAEPSVAAALDGSRATVPGPAGGRQLGRATLADRATIARTVSDGDATGAVDRERRRIEREVRRATGTFGRVVP